MPVTDKVFTIPIGYFIEPNYLVTANSNRTFSVAFNTADAKTMKDDGVNLVEGPFIRKADATTREFNFQYLVEFGGAY